MQKPWQEIVVMLHSEINCVFQEGDHSFKGKRFLPQDTIKFGCAAKIFMSEVVRFAGYKITDNTERLRRGMSDRLRTDVKNGQRPQFERRIYISLPLEEDHKDHVLGEVDYQNRCHMTT
ncbi:uncharacterized protein LOC122953196 [Acropora millepora]|uniref:uncharacterized protein LOC122953196 n=1 Tax=Acropora millepora TaxID=45264 RepID=UPI001CF4690A|nr:uncharacterized protein LOC122953196 [Acropora millepora]